LVQVVGVVVVAEMEAMFDHIGDEAKKYKFDSLNLKYNQDK
jgi:hypothetical protein